MWNTRVVWLSLWGVIAAVSACGGADTGVPTQRVAGGAANEPSQAATGETTNEPDTADEPSQPASGNSSTTTTDTHSEAPSGAQTRSAPVTIQERTALASVPYALPQPGTAVSIGTNVADDIRPAPFTRLEWAYSLFQSFGTGAYVPDFSDAGAFVIAASGGHAVPPNLDAAVFDFSDATWKVVTNSNGIAPRSGDYNIGETTGAPYYEIPGAQAGQVPAPPHLYALTSYVPAAHGGGEKGSFLKMGSPAVTVQSRQGGGIHKMDLATGMWTRVTSDTLPFGYDYEASTVLDPEQGRYYFIVDNFHGNTSLPYLDLADLKVKQTPAYPYPRQLASSYTAYQTVFLDPVRRLLVAQRPGIPMQALDLNDIPAGWRALNTTGTQPGSANRWAFYPPDGRFYTRTNNSGQTLYRLTPPANWKTGTWTIDTVTITGASMPDFTTTAGTVRHYGTFFYVPALRSLAWISGEDTPVVLLKPPA